VGIFTERDAIRIIASDVPLDTPIDQVMTKNVATIGEEASVEEARRLEAKRQNGYLYQFQTLILKAQFR
jgi:CBS domain-containing protein